MTTAASILASNQSAAQGGPRKACACFFLINARSAPDIGEIRQFPVIGVLAGPACTDFPARFPGVPF
jgi:hypothetical protein